MASQFHLEWYRCLDGYAFKEPQPDPPWMEEGTILGERIPDLDGRDIVAIGRRWEKVEPFRISGAYKQFAAWDGTDEGLLKLVKAFGLLNGARSQRDSVDRVEKLISELARFVERIDRGEWEPIADALNLTAQSRPGGVGCLALVVDFSELDRPRLKLQPRDLWHALWVQAASDVFHGIEHKKCRNLECDRWFPISGPDALRSDAEYHDEACRRRHAYLMRKATITKKERRR